MPKRDFTNSYDKMFDYNNDGKIDMLEQYAEIEYLSAGAIRAEDAEIAYDHLMHSKSPNLGFPASLVKENDEFAEDDCDDYEDEEDDGFDDITDDYDNDYDL